MTDIFQDSSEKSPFRQKRHKILAPPQFYDIIKLNQKLLWKLLCKKIAFKFS